LVLNSDNCDGILAKVQPPIRTKEDNEALWQGIREGVIDSVGTDHAAARSEQKGESIWNAGLGIPGIAHWLQIMLSEGVNKGRISLEKLVEVCCYNPAFLHGLTPKKGLIAVGSDADLVIVDLEKEVVAGPSPPYTGTDFNVYEGWKFKGCAILTIVRGKVVMQDGKVVGTPGFGRYNPARTR
jgi:dihydropyrimidinase